MARDRWAQTGDAILRPLKRLLDSLKSDRSTSHVLQLVERKHYKAYLV